MKSPQCLKFKVTHKMVKEKNYHREEAKRYIFYVCELWKTLNN